MEKGKVRVKINGSNYTFSDSKDFLYGVLTLLDTRSRFEVFGENLKSGLEFVCEFCEISKDKNSRSVNRKLGSILKYFDRYKTKRKLLEVYYNLFLYLDGLSLLPGFSVSAPIPKKCNYNPERYSIMWEG